MSTTLEFSVTDAAWTEVSSGSTNVSVQRQSRSFVLVHVGTTAPALGGPAIIIGSLDTIFSASGLGGTDKVFVRAFREPTVVTVVRS
jgi:hypothetical protein